MLRTLPLPDRAAPRRARSSPVAAAGVVSTAVAAAGAVALGVVLGLLLTAAATRSDSIGTRRAGAWRLFADAGSAAANPYGRARLARTGEVPLATAQGLTAVAREDSAGEALDGRCSYGVAGAVPPARFWSLAATSTAGLPFANPAGRQAFTSTDVLRDVAGRFTLALAPTVQPGNWLPLPDAGHFELVLRLYETGLGAAASAGPAAGGFPTITRLGCGS